MAHRPSAVITGGGSGIGLATAAALHAEGYALTLVGRRAEVLLAAADTLAGGAPVATCPADLAVPEACDQVVAEHVERWGGLDALVAGAGAYEPGGIGELTAAVWDATMDVQVRAAVLCAAAAARQMRRDGRGRIVLISSVNGFHSEPDTIAYSAAKTAIISVARSLAVDLAGDDVAVNAVAPGWVRTPMTVEYLAASTPDQLRRVNPLGRAGEADEVASLIRYLVVEAPLFLTGATITIDGGQTAMAPLP